jgi:ferredoxin
MNVRVDAELCTGHGRCYVFAPAVFRPDDEGYNDRRGSTVTVPADAVADVQVAIANCPEAALSIEEE